MKKLHFLQSQRQIGCLSCISCFTWAFRWTPFWGVIRWPVSVAALIASWPLCVSCLPDLSILKAWLSAPLSLKWEQGAKLRKRFLLDCALGAGLWSFTHPLRLGDTCRHHPTPKGRVLQFHTTAVKPSPTCATVTPQPGLFSACFWWRPFDRGRESHFMNLFSLLPYSSDFRLPLHWRELWLFVG